MIPINFSLAAAGLHVLAVHSDHINTPFFILDVMKGFEVIYEMNTDHDVFSLKMTDIILGDLTKYPYTIDPAKYNGTQPAIEKMQEFREIG